MLFGNQISKDVFPLSWVFTISCLFLLCWQNILRIFTHSSLISSLRYFFYLLFIDHHQIVALQCFIKHGEWKWSFFINDKSGIVNLVLFIYMHYFSLSCQAFRTIFALMYEILLYVGSHLTGMALWL